MKKLLLIGSVFLVLYPSCTRIMVSDADGNVYPTVKIGNQIWTKDNLRTTKFNDGVPIPHVPDCVAWNNLTSPAYCHYGNATNADSVKRFGALYNWHCIGSNKLAPPGWHVSTDDDWDTLQNYLIKHGYNWDGRRTDNRIAKALAARSDWKPFPIKGMPGNNMKENNKSGFSGFPAGYRLDSQDSAVFKAKGHTAAWWSATKVNESVANVYGIGFCIDDLIKYQQRMKTGGYPVRLVKNTK